MGCLLSNHWAVVSLVETSCAELETLRQCLAVEHRSALNLPPRTVQLPQAECWASQVWTTIPGTSRRRVEWRQKKEIFSVASHPPILFLGFFWNQTTALSRPFQKFAERHKSTLRLQGELLVTNRGPSLCHKSFLPQGNTFSPGKKIIKMKDRRQRRACLFLQHPGGRAQRMTTHSELVSGVA